jgi:hypothetical protein
MSSRRPLRAAGIALCMVLLYLPTRTYFSLPPEWGVLGVLLRCWPGWLFLYGHLFLQEGREQGRELERRAREQKEQGK